MLINTVIKNLYPIQESKSDGAIKKLGEYLDGVYNKGARWGYNGIEPTMGEVSELYDVYKHIVHDKVDLPNITTISKNVSDMLKAFGFNVVEQGVGWALSEAKKPDKLPAWAKKMFNEQTPGGRILDVYVNGDTCEITADVFGDVTRYVMRKDGFIGEK